MKATFGDEVSPFAIEKMTLALNQKVIVSIISPTILICKTHYIQDVGGFHCFDEQCCMGEGLPSVRYVLPVYRYQTDGELTVVGKELSLEMISRGIADYRNLKTKHDILKTQGSSITKVNILITCTEAKYQKWQFDILGDSTWRELTNKARYKEDMNRFISRGEETFGRKVNFTQYQKMAELDTPVQDRPSSPSDIQSGAQALPAPPEEIVIDDFEDLMNEDLPVSMTETTSLPDREDDDTPF